MTIRDFNQHAIIANGGVDSPIYRNLHIIDIGDQFLKNNPTLDGLNGIDNGILENSLLEILPRHPTLTLTVWMFTEGRTGLFATIHSRISGVAAV